MRGISSRPGVRGIAAESTALIIGTLLSGLAMYAFISIGNRSFGAAAFAPITVLWTVWLIAAAVLTFPLQHWAIHRIRLDGHDGAIAGTLPRLGIMVAGVAAALAAVAALAGERLFNSTSAVWPILVFLVTVSAAVVGLQRGVLAGRGRFYAAATAIAAENFIRLAAGLVVLALTDSVLPFAATLTLGAAVALLWPEAWRFSSPTRPHTSALAFLSGLAGGMVLAQVVLNVGPAVLKAIGGEDADVTGLFVSLALFRAPYLLALGLAARVTGPLTGLVADRRWGLLRRVLAWTTAATIVGAGLGALFGYAVGPWLVDLVFGAGVSPSSAVVAGIAAGSVVALTGLLLILIIASAGRTRAVAAAWIAGLGAGAAVLAATSGSDLDRVVAAFVVAEVVAFAGMAGYLGKWLRTGHG